MSGPRPRQSGPAPRRTRNADPLIAVAAKAQAKQGADLALTRAIRQARQAGATLEQIGKAAGLTRARIHQIVHTTQAQEETS